MIIAQQRQIAQLDDDFEELSPLTTFSDNLLVESPYGEILIKSALKGTWNRCVMGCTAPFNQRGTSLTLFHESLNNVHQTKMPEASYEDTRYFHNAMVHLFIHRNKAGIADYCNLIYPNGNIIISTQH